MHRRGLRRFVLLPVAALSVLLVAGCDSAPPLRWNDLPPLAAGQGRIFFYRELGLYDPPDWTAVSLNGSQIGQSRPGAAFYRDVAPGTYEITVRSEGLYPDQFKRVVLAAGDTVFAKIHALRGYEESATESTEVAFAVTIVDPAVAQGEMARLRLDGPAVAAMPR